MKQVVLSAILIFSLAINFAFADTTDSKNVLTEETVKSMPQVVYNFGATAAWLTRIIKQEKFGRSNFVFKDFFPGAYFSAELHKLPVVPFIIPEVRVAAYYPLISKFNEMKQANRPLDIGLDFFAGVRFELVKGFFKLNAGPGLHFFYMSSARWHYFNLGGAIAAGIEFAFSPKWSIVVDVLASIDSGNLGGNKNMELFDMTYQYQTSIGARYSKKVLNESPIFTPKEKAPKEKRKNEKADTKESIVKNETADDSKPNNENNETASDSKPNGENHRNLLDR